MTIGTTAHPTLERRLGLRAAIAIVVGEVIGVGIFLTPAEMAKGLGSPLWLLIVWLVMGTMALCGALCFGELAARWPEAGGQYVYLRETYGLRWAFLYGWMAMLVMDPGITAALAVGFAQYAGYAVPMGPLAAKGAAMAAIIVLAALNIVGLRQSAGVVRALTVLKVGFLAFLAVWAFGGQLGDMGHFAPFATRPADAGPLFGALAGGLVGAFFAFGGWWDLSKLGGEVKDARRTLPRAMIWGVGIVTAVYIVTSAAFIYLVPLTAVGDGEAFVARVGEVLFGTAGGRLFAGIVIVSVLGSLAGLLMAAPRVYYAMAEDGVFFRALGAVDPRWHTPARAIAVQAVLGCVLVALGTFDAILAYFIFTVVLFLAGTAAAVIVQRRRSGPPEGFAMPLYPLPPIVFLVLTAVMLFLFLGGGPMQALAGLAVTALGLPVYEVVRRARDNVPRTS
ncbi:MAG: amino acid permease [Ardenticatenales bacterium]|jgi:APA family basic amino acid/polyamine antiporter|nr:amino acid permease [Ardenticatenales bacterium]